MFHSFDSRLLISFVPAALATATPISPRRRWRSNATEVRSALEPYYNHRSNLLRTSTTAAGWDNEASGRLHDWHKWPARLRAELDNTESISELQGVPRQAELPAAAVLPTELEEENFDEQSMSENDLVNDDENTHTNEIVLHQNIAPEGLVEARIEDRPLVSTAPLYRSDATRRRSRSM